MLSQAYYMLIVRYHRSRIIYWQPFPAFFASHATGSLLLVFAAECGICATLPFALFDDIV